MYDELVLPPSVCLEIDRVIGLYNRNVEKSAMYEALAGISPEPPAQGFSENGSFNESVKLGGEE